MLLLFVSSVFGLTPRYSGDSFGNNQYYDVVFDEEGEANVNVRIDLSNIEKGNLDFFVVEIPGQVRMINSVIGYKIVEKRCVDYREKECVEWQEYYGYREKYYTLDYTNENLGDRFRYVFNLPVSVKEQESVKLLLNYKVLGYVSKDLVYNFEFETVKEKYDLGNVRVAIKVVDDLILEGGKGETNYNYAVLGTFKGMSVESDALRGVSDSIMWSPGYVKETSGLDPWENFSVKGKYSRSWFLLNVWKVLGSLIGIGLIVLGLIYFIKKNKNLNWKIALSSFGSGLGIVLSGYLMFYLMRNMRFSWEVQQFFMMFIMMIFGIVLISLLFGPSVYFGWKYKNISLGVGCFIGTVIWLVLIGFGLFGVFRTEVNPVYNGMMEVAVEKVI